MRIVHPEKEADQGMVNIFRHRLEEKEFWSADVG